jgi:hypothetical protein
MTNIKVYTAFIGVSMKSPIFGVVALYFNLLLLSYSRSTLLSLEKTYLSLPNKGALRDFSMTDE